MKLFGASLIAVSLLATFTAAHAGVIVGATRVIYHGASKEETLSVKNPEKDTPYMLQSWVENANHGQQAKTFVITPPIFKLDLAKRPTCVLSIWAPTFLKTESLFFGWMSNQHQEH